MANIDYPRGLLNPSPLTEQVACRTFTAAAEIFRGDPCTLGADGTVTRVADGTATAFDVVALHYAAASAKVVCCINPGSVSFEAQLDDGTVVTDVLGKTFDIIQAAGDTVRKTSGCEIDGDTGHATTGCVRIVDMVNRPNNDQDAANKVVRVTKVQTALPDIM